MSIELKTASGGSVTLVPEDGVSNVTATVKHESGVLASEFDAGVGRTWQNVTASRAGGITYTNNTNRDIIVSAYTERVTDNVDVFLLVNGVFVDRYRNDADAQKRGAVSGVVPKGATYEISFAIAPQSIANWAELR